MKDCIEKDPYYWVVIHNLVLLMTSPVAMILTIIGTVYWFSQVPKGFDKVDSLLAGGAMLLAQSIVREQRAAKLKDSNG